MHSHLQNKKKKDWNGMIKGMLSTSHLTFTTSMNCPYFFAQNPTFSSILSLYIILNGWDVCDWLVRHLHTRSVQIDSGSYIFKRSIMLER